MKLTLAATAALLAVSGAALAQTTSVQSAPPASDTGSNAYQTQGTASPGNPASSPTTHHASRHRNRHHHTAHHTSHHPTPAATNPNGAPSPQ